ncbi:MAG: hypothetical protein MSC31_14455 [Solirubrobacteraceae bacterium MAG38_C4-C5]|nr:hypothetical protein [Candidatus Siliceabacter maunaloa]
MTLSEGGGADPKLTLRALATFRLGLIPAALVAQRLIPRDGTDSGLFDLVLAGGLAYALLGMLFAWHAEDPAGPLRWWSACDLAFVGALTFFSGGASSPVRFAFFAVPFAAAFLARPRGAACWCVTALSTYALVAIARPVGGAEPALSYTLAQLGFLAWASVAAVTFAAALGRRTEELGAERDRARRLAAQAVDTESRERQRLADALHDHAVQHLSVASRDIGSALEGDPGQLVDAKSAVEEALRQLRGEIFDLCPHVLDHAGLDGALAELVGRESHHGGFVPDLTVDPGVEGVADLIVLSTARELLSNAAKHAHAHRVTIRVGQEDGFLILRVLDDGRGFRAERREEAIRELHYGLMATTERIEALGGTLVVVSAPGAGTAATARIPVAAGRLLAASGAQRGEQSVIAETL